MYVEEFPRQNKSFEFFIFILCFLLFCCCYSRFLSRRTRARKKHQFLFYLSRLVVNEIVFTSNREVKLFKVSFWFFYWRDQKILMGTKIKLNWILIEMVSNWVDNNFTVTNLFEAYKKLIYSLAFNFMRISLVRKIGIFLLL